MSTPALAASDLALGAPVAVRLADWGVIRAKGDDAALVPQRPAHPGVDQAGRRPGAAGRLLLAQGPAAGQLRDVARRARRDPARLQRRPARAHAQAPVDVRDARQVQADRRVGRARAVGRRPARPAARRRRASRARRPVRHRGRSPAAPPSAWPTPPAPRACCGPRRPTPRRRGTTTSSADVWNWLEVQSGVPRIVASTVEAFVPQMVNLELVGGVNFQKGCYPGQEIVARSQYRGTLKRRMVLAEGASAARRRRRGVRGRRPRPARRPGGAVGQPAAPRGRRAPCGADRGQARAGRGRRAAPGRGRRPRCAPARRCPTRSRPTAT